MPRPSKSQPAAAPGPRLVTKSARKPPVQLDVTHEQIAARAYELFEQEGYAHGRHTDHWLRAEHDLKAVVAEPSPKPVAGTRARR